MFYILVCRFFTIYCCVDYLRLFFFYIKKGITAAIPLIAYRFNIRDYFFTSFFTIVLALVVVIFTRYNPGGKCDILMVAFVLEYTLLPVILNRFTCSIGVKALMVIRPSVGFGYMLML